MRDAWRHYRGAALPLIVVFCIAHVVAALLPYLVRFDVPNAVGYPLVFLLRVVVPVILGTVAVAIGTIVVNGPADPDHDAEARPGLAAATARLRGRTGDVLTLGVVAALMGIGAVFLLGAYGFLILHLFYGPPIAIQVALRQGLGTRAALQRARALLRGSWRAILYLLNAALAIGALSLLLLDLFVRLVGGGPEVVTRISLAMLQGVVLGTLAAFVAGAQVAIYAYLLEREAGGADVDAIEDVPAS